MMPWKVPLFSETGELEWFDAAPSTARLRPDAAGDAADLEQVRRDEANAHYEEMANEETRRGGQYSGYFGGYRR
jgi:hypothetical protein